MRKMKSSHENFINKGRALNLYSICELNTEGVSIPVTELSFRRKLEGICRALRR
jgi:hypothetical protein